MDIFIPHRKLWIPDNTIADSLASPIGINRMLKWNRSRRICHLTPHRVMMGAAGSVIGDETSYVFDGTDDYLTIPDSADWDFGAGNFTIDLWVNITDTGENTFFSQWDTNQKATRLRNNSSGNLSFFLSDNGTSDSFNQTSAETLSTGVWIHVAIVRNGNNILGFLDGVQVTWTTAYSGTIHNSTATETIGRVLIDTSQDLNGRIDEFRISKGVTRWTSNFTPPTSQYNIDGSTDLLIHCGEAVVSGSKGTNGWTSLDATGNHTITGRGDVDEDIVNYKF